MTELDLEALGLTADKILNVQPMQSEIGSQIAMGLAERILSVPTMPANALSDLYNALEQKENHSFSFSVR